jgi:hypothetical protein
MFDRRSQDRVKGSRDRAIRGAVVAIIGRRGQVTQSRDPFSRSPIAKSAIYITRSAVHQSQMERGSRD